MEKLAKTHTIWVVGGNHSYEAIRQLQQEFPHKQVFQQTKISLWWWSDLDSQLNLSEIETLAAHHNVDLEVRKKWEFVDKLSFIRRNFVRLPTSKGTKEATEEVRVALGLKNAASVSPLLQLVGGTTEKFELVSRIVKANQKTVKSESKFRCLQGDLTSQQQIQLLKQVADGAITLDEMHNQAEEIKLDVRNKKASALLLQKDTFEQVETDYGTQAFSDERRRGFFPAFKQLLQKRR